MNKNKDDGIVIWELPKNLNFLPRDIEEDALSFLLRLLIIKVKEDHAMFQYKKELKSYVREIMEIVNFARAHGYQKTNIKNTKYASNFNELNGEFNQEMTNNNSNSTTTNTDDSDIDFSKIVDG